MPISPAPVFRWFIPAQPGTGGGLVPAAGYKAKWFEPGGVFATAKTIYTDAALAVPYSSPSNTAVLDAEGKALIYLKPGETYDLQVTDPDDVVVFSAEGLKGSGGVGVATADNFEALKDVDTVNKYAWIPGYWAVGDGGHGFFYRGSSTTADGGYIQSSDFDPNFSWYRVPDEDGFIRAASYGVDQGTGTVRSTEMQAADAYAAGQGRPLLVDTQSVVGNGNNPVKIGPMTFSAPRVVFIGPRLLGIDGAPSAIIFTGLVEAPPNFYFDNLTVTLNHPDQEVRPEWWNTTKDGTGTGDTIPPATDDLAKINAMFASGAAKFIFAEGDYEVTAEPTWPATGTIESFGTVTQGGATHLSPGLWVLDSGSLVKADNLESVTNINAGNNIIAGNDSSAVRDLLAGNNVVAGVTGSGTNGYLEGRAGTGAQKFRAGGRVLQDLTIKNVTGDNTEKNLLSAVLPANTLINNGDTLDIYTWIRELNNGSNDSIDFVYKVYIDGQVIYEALHINNAAAAAGAGIDLQGPFRLKLVKVTDDTPPNSGLECTGDLFLTGPQVGTATVGPADLGADVRGVILDLTSAQTIQFTVTIEDGDGIQQASQSRLYIDFKPAEV